MRTALIGAVRSTRTALEELKRDGCAPLTTITIDPGKSSRHSDYDDIREAAFAAGSEVVLASTGDEPHVKEALERSRVDYLFVIGWSRIVKPEVRALASHGTIGYHPSALPRNRGRAVVPWTILKGLRETGSTLFWLDDGVDSGDIAGQATFAVAPDETALTLYEKHINALRTLLGKLLDELATGHRPAVPQDPSLATYCARRSDDDGWINWERSAENIWTLIRAVSHPYPGAFTLRNGTRMRIWTADYVGHSVYTGLPGQVQAIESDSVLVACGDSRLLRIRDIQIEGEEVRSANSVLKLHEKLASSVYDVWKYALKPGNL